MDLLLILETRKTTKLNSRKTTKLIYISGNEKCSKIGKHRGVRAATAPPSRPRMNLLMFGRGCRRRRCACAGRAAGSVAAGPPAAPNLWRVAQRAVAASLAVGHLRARRSPLATDRELDLAGAGAGNDPNLAGAGNWPGPGIGRSRIWPGPGIFLKIW